MNVICNRWEKNQCRYEKSLFWPNDQFAAYTFDAKQLSVGSISPIERLIAKSPDGWINLSTIVTIQSNNWEFRGGDSSSEAEGWVAALKNNQLEWIFHLSNSESIRQLTVEGSTLIALGSEYPFQNTFRIQFKNPLQIEVSTIIET